MGTDLSQLKDQQYINLETYKKSGQPVATPVWFTFDSSNRLFVVTRDDTGKVKRIRNNQNVRIVPCSMRGEPKSEWIPAKARFASQEEQDLALKQRSKKYGFKAKIAGIFSSGKGRLVALSISTDENT